MTPPGLPDDAFEEYDRAETIAAIGRALEALGVRVEAVPADRRLPWRLDEGRYDFAFNVAEGAGRRCRESIPAAVCELLTAFPSPARTRSRWPSRWTRRWPVAPCRPRCRSRPRSSSRPRTTKHALAALRYPVRRQAQRRGLEQGHP